MTSEQRKTIEREFYKYKFNKRTCSNYAVCAVAYDSSVPDGERVKSSSGNRNEQLVIRAIYDQERMRAWCTVFEKTQDKFRWEHKDELMRKKYIERKKPYRICDELSIADRTYHYWHNQVLEVAFMWAKELKLL